MSNKSKAIEVKSVMVDTEYVRTLEALWENAVDLFNYTTNRLGELYRISSVVRMFAYNKAKMDKIREDLDKAIKNNDMAELRRIKKLMEYNQELKAWDSMWTEVSRDFDNLITNYGSDAEITDSEYQIKTADEILQDTIKSAVSFDKKRFEKEAQALLLEIQL